METGIKLLMGLIVLIVLGIMLENIRSFLMAHPEVGYILSIVLFVGVMWYQGTKKED